jgi:hypothetical protein
MHLWTKRGLRGTLGIGAITAAGCVHMAPRLYAPIQPDGWSAQPVAITWRFAPDADLDPATRTPVGEAGYYLHILTRAGDWDYSNTRSFLLSHAREPWGHCWLILESPGNRLECGVTGNFGRERPEYGAGVRQRLRDGDPNPIAYLWVTMSDGQLQIDDGRRTPTFVWRMPITKRRHELIRQHVMHWKYGEIGVRTNNCVDMVTEGAQLAGINLIHRIRLTVPPEVEVLGKPLRMWTDPQYRILEYSTPDVLEADLRHLARFGIGREVTREYLASRTGRAADASWSGSTRRSRGPEPPPGPPPPPECGREAPQGRGPR